jgi:radial spoke head protein 1
MGDEDEEPKYKLFVKGQDAPLEKGSQQFTGQGKAFYLNGDTYDGTYVEGLRRGTGLYTFKKFGDSYEGQYEENKKHGFGKLEYRHELGEDEEAADDEESKVPRGGTYVGHFHAGRRGCADGTTEMDEASEGTFTYVNGDEYVGQWCAGKKHGQGTYSYKKDGTKLVGKWEKGKITAGKWIFPNGTFYSGAFRYNKPFGKGIWVFPNGNQMTGEYVQKEQQAEDEPPPADDDGPVVERPDPKVWCHFKYGTSAAVRGGALVIRKAEP